MFNTKPLQHTHCNTPHIRIHRVFSSPPMPPPPLTGSLSLYTSSSMRMSPGPHPQRQVPPHHHIRPRHCTATPCTAIRRQYSGADHGICCFDKYGAAFCTGESRASKTQGGEAIGGAGAVNGCYTAVEWCVGTAGRHVMEEGKEGLWGCIGVLHHPVLYTPPHIHYHHPPHHTYPPHHPPVHSTEPVVWPRSSSEANGVGSSTLGRHTCPPA